MVFAILQVCATCFAGVGLFITAAAFRKRLQQDRQEILFRFWSEFWKQEKTTQLFYKIEYNLFKYSAEFHLSDDERALDQLLGHFQFIAVQYKTGLLKDSDLEVMAYFSQRVFGNTEVQKYLTFLQEWAEQNSLAKHPYSDAVKLNERIKLLYDMRTKDRC